MTDQDSENREDQQMSLALRAGLSVIAAGFAALFVHQALGELITAGVAALFFGFGVFITIGRGGHGAGVDGGDGGDGGGG